MEDGAKPAIALLTSAALDLFESARSAGYLSIYLISLYLPLWFSGLGRSVRSRGCVSRLHSHAPSSRRAPQQEEKEDGRVKQWER